MRRTMKLSIIYKILLLLIGLSISPDESMAELTATANHDRISVDFFYHGSSVSIRGVSDPGVDLVVKVSSDEGHYALKQKGKVGGVLWMNVGSMKFERVPSVYFVSSTKDLDQMLCQEDRDKHVLGYDSLIKHAEIDPMPDGADRKTWMDEFVKFKKSSRLYSVNSANFTLNEKDGKQHYYLLMDWPYQAMPGNYTITVYAVRDKKVVETAETHVVVEQVGLVKTLAGMARNNGALYGIISVIAALGAGFGVGMVFRKGGGSH